MLRSTTERCRPSRSEDSTAGRAMRPLMPRQLGLDHSALPLAAHGGHWTAMATLAVSIVVLVLLAATRPRGWRVPVWSVAGAALLFGAVSATLPHMPSSIGPIWGALVAV
jgi:hypothetical protein